MPIITNNVPRDVVEASELTPAEREEFDYIDWPKIAVGEDSASFFRYKGELYDLGDCEMSTSPLSPLAQWDGFYSETFFSAVVFRYVDEGDRVIVGRYFAGEET